MLVRRLEPSDAAAFREVRLRGLLETPTAFASSHEEERDESAEAVAARLARSAVFGAFDGGALAGVVGIGRERFLKMAHKRILWGMYVAPEARGRGAGRRLVRAALDHAFAQPGVLRVLLSVHAGNVPAIALYHATGFRPYAVERDFMLVEGVLHDEILMACERNGWECLRARETEER